MPGRAELLARVAELSAASVTANRFAMAGEHVFFLRRDGVAAVVVLVVPTGDEERLLLDPARSRPGNTATSTGSCPAPTGGMWRVVSG